MRLQVKPPEKKKRKTKSSSLPLSSSTTSFSLLPDDITISYLARIPRSYYPRLSIVSKSFRSLLSSSELYTARSQLGTTEQCLYVCLKNYKDQIPQWFTLWDNPNRTLPNSSITKKKKTTSPKSFVSIPPSNCPLQSSSILAVGSEIYVIGGYNGAPSAAVQILDCRSHTWRDGPSMNVARVSALSCVYDGKIYVVGGHKGGEDGRRKELVDDEVFDTKTQTWERLPDRGIETRKRDIYIIAEIEGKINFGTYNRIYFAYDTKQGKWEPFQREGANFPMSQCVIENVSYRYGNYYQCFCEWHDIKDGEWKEVKGLESLQNKHRRNGCSYLSNRELVSCGGKLLFIWQESMKPRKRIWCAEILLEKRDEGEVWGNVEWVDFVHTFPVPCNPSHCLAVSM